MYIYEYDINICICIYACIYIYTCMYVYIQVLGALADVGVEGVCEGSGGEGVCEGSGGEDAGAVGSPKLPPKTKKGGEGGGAVGREMRRRERLLARLETEEGAASLAECLALALVLAQLPAKKEKQGPGAGAGQGRRLAAAVGRLERHLDASRRMLLRYQVAL